MIVNPMGQRFILKDAAKTKQIERSYEKHVQKIENLLKPKVKNNEEHLQVKGWRENVRQNMFRFNSQEKFRDIDRDNQTLMVKLISISKRSDHFMKRNRSVSTLPTTLNGGIRKRELERIAIENAAFAKRIYGQKSMLDRKKIDDDFEKHEQAKNRLLRITNSLKSPKESKRRLPPILNISRNSDLDASRLKIRKELDLSAIRKEGEASVLERGRAASTTLETKDVQGAQDVHNAIQNLQSEKVELNELNESPLNESKQIANDD